MDHQVHWATADEYPAIISFWVRSFRNSPWAGCISNGQWGIAARATYRGLVARGARALVVRRAGRFAGFCVVEGDVIHYLYVKRWFRGTGVARALLAAATSAPVKPTRFTHRTESSGLLERRGLRWDPVPART